MRKLVISICVCFLLNNLGCSEDATGIGDLSPLPEAISSLPIGMLIEPERSIAEAQHYDGGSLEGLSGPNTYTWNHSLIIQAIGSDVQIIEYGVYSWADGQWIDVTEELTPYTAEMFAEVFECKDAILRVGEVYESDLFSNASNVPQSTPVIYRWYFIGETDKGRCYGEATLVDRPPKMR